MEFSSTFLSHKWKILFITALGVFLMPLDSSMLFIAAPQIAAAFHEDAALATWVPTASLIGVTAFSIPLGRLSDVWGRKRLYLVGLVVAGIVALTAGFARNSYHLIGLRLVTGICSALISTNSWALISEVFPARERGKALGINTACVFVGLSAGPVIGGLLITQFGTWRATFFSVAPFYLIVAALSFRWLPETKPSGLRRPSDLPGALSFISALSLLVLGLSLGRTSGWSSLITITVLGLSFIMSVLFVYLELRVAKDPMLDLRIFGRNSQFTLGNLSTLFHYISAHQGLTVLVSFYVQWVLNRSAAVAGVMTLAKYLTMAVFSPFCGWLSDRIGPRWLCTLGMILVTVSLVLLAGMAPDTGLIDAFSRLCLLGVGIGLFASPNINSVLSSLPQDQLGTASGTLNTFRSLGSALGMVLIGGILSGGTTASGFAAQVQTAFLALSIVGFLGVMVSASRKKAAA
ncbi:MAG: MFS transporter [Desulfobacterales bacterium]|nr:MFS transporter [Desulfobacterales bacterium]